LKEYYRILIAGDFHIPTRARSLPEEFNKFLEDNNFDLVAITGDLVQSYVLESFKRFKYVVVRGNWDLGDAAKFPELCRIKIPGAKYNVILYHGSDIYPNGEPMLLRAVGLKHNAQVIITGHTHIPEIKMIIDSLIINPGSATGVYGSYKDAYKKQIRPTWIVADFGTNWIDISLYAIIGAGKIKKYPKKRFEF